MRYRIVTDRYGGFEAQSRPAWWPFWFQFGGVNTHGSVEEAEAYIRKGHKRVVKYVDTTTHSAKEEGA